MDTSKLGLSELTISEQKEYCGGLSFNLLDRVLAAIALGWDIGWTLGSGLRKTFFY